VVVVDASGVDAVELSGIAVGNDKPGLVGGSVEVTKAAGAPVAVCSDTLMQEPRLRLVSRMKIQIFFIRGGLYFKSIKPILIGCGGVQNLQILLPRSGPPPLHLGDAAQRLRTPNLSTFYGFAKTRT
jgi:hypothetical protein